MARFSKNAKCTIFMESVSPDIRTCAAFSCGKGLTAFRCENGHKEAYYEQERKPFETRWDQGHHIIIEDRVPWHDNVVYPKKL